MGTVFCWAHQNVFLWPSHCQVPHQASNRKLAIRLWELGLGSEETQLMKRAAITSGYTKSPELKEAVLPSALNKVTTVEIKSYAEFAENEEEMHSSVMLASRWNKTLPKLSSAFPKSSNMNTIESLGAAVVLNEWHVRQRAQWEFSMKKRQFNTACSDRGAVRYFLKIRWQLKR